MKFPLMVFSEGQPKNFHRGGGVQVSVIKQEGIVV